MPVTGTTCFINSRSLWGYHVTPGEKSKKRFNKMQEKSQKATRVALNGSVVSDMERKELKSACWSGSNIGSDHAIYRADKAYVEQNDVTYRLKGYCSKTSLTPGK